MICANCGCEIPADRVERGFIARVPTQFCSMRCKQRVCDRKRQARRAEAVRIVEYMERHCPAALKQITRQLAAAAASEQVAAE